MAVISISIIESSEQLVAGIPTSVSISANLPCNIFYTLDGTDPITTSSVYIFPIVLPRGSLSITLKVWATNGTDNSAIITNVYSTNIMHNARVPHAAVINHGGQPKISLFPFGTNSPSSAFDYINAGNAGITVLDPSKPVIPYGYTADGYTVGTNKPLSDYLNVYSQTDNVNRVFPNVGNMPGGVEVIRRRVPTEYEGESSDRSSRLFNSKARVIFQDLRTEDPSNPPQINSQFFSMEKLEVADGGAMLYPTFMSTPTVRGSFIRSEYNARDQTVTDYFRCSDTNRWIISTYPFNRNQVQPGNISNMVFSRRGSGVGNVYRWNLFRYSTLT